MSEAVKIPLLIRALGGLLPGHAYLFHGGEGVGKTVLGIQTAHAWVKTGQAVLYVSSDRSAHLLEHAATLGLALYDEWRDGRFIPCEYVPTASKQLRNLVAGVLLERLKQVAATTPVSAVVFDPLDPFISRRIGQGREPGPLAELLEALRGWGWTSILLAGSKRLQRNRTAHEILKEQCWATIEMRRLGRKGKRARSYQSRMSGGTYVLEIEKARQPTPGGHRIGYKVAVGAGLIPVPESLPWDEEWVPSDPRSTTPRVLLASQEADLFKPLAGLLRRTAETEIVADGVEALARAVTWAPHVIVAETSLPRLSGFAVARVLRQGQYAMPIVLVSRATRRHSERVRAYLNGATDFVFFPFDLQDLVYKVRVASQMRLSSFQDGVEEQMLEVLLKKAKSHVLDVATFLQALSLSLHSSSRFSSPVSLVTFRLCLDQCDSAIEQFWQVFKELVDEKVRNGDLICLPNDRDIAILLCHETRHGATAFARRLRHLVEREKDRLVMGRQNWRIEISTQTLQMPEHEREDLRGLLNSAFACPVTFLAPDHPGGDTIGKSDEEVGKWGT